MEASCGHPDSEVVFPLTKTLLLDIQMRREKQKSMVVTSTTTFVPLECVKVHEGWLSPIRIEPSAVMDANVVTV